MLRPTPGDPWGVEQHHWNTGAEENQQLNPGGPRSTSAFHLCRDFQRCEVPLPYFYSALTVKDLKCAFPANFLLSALLFCQDFKRSQIPFPHLFDQDFQRCEGPLPHFISAGTSKHVKFRFRTSAMLWLLNSWSSASALPFCHHSPRCEVRLPHLCLHWLP